MFEYNDRRQTGQVKLWAAQGWNLGPKWALWEKSLYNNQLTLSLGTRLKSPKVNIFFLSMVQRAVISASDMGDW